MGTKSGDRHSSPKSLNTATSLEVDGDTYNTVGPTYHHSTMSMGKETIEGNGDSGGNTTWHLIFWHHQGKRQRSRDARGGHSLKHRQRPMARASLTQEGNKELGEIGLS